MGGFKGKTNIYTCRKCQGKTITVDVDQGVTPFMIGCRASGREGDCDGIAESSLYRIPPDTPPAQWEWYAPPKSETQKMNRQSREHAANGGLFLRKIGNGKAVYEIGVEITPIQLRELRAFLYMKKMPYYLEPPRANPYNSLEELEADCEGK